jgi:uncharacterized repeat protein (TIGR03803 family)
MIQTQRYGKKATIFFALCAAAAIGSPAQTFTVLKRFNGTNGTAPNGLAQGIDGNFYGTTSAGGTSGNGTVFRLTPEGTLKSLHSFCADNGCPDGSVPGALLLGNSGDFYGLTTLGGAYDIGSIFEIKSNGKLTTLYNFCATDNCPDGAWPGSLIQGADGNFYGTASEGGANANSGTVFEYKATRPARLTPLHEFCSFAGCTDGGDPGTMLQGTDGNFYGTTGDNGTHLRGTVFQMTPAGALTTLYSFCAATDCTDGAVPGGLLQATDGVFYGVTYFGGTSTNCTSGCGTVFLVTADGGMATLHDFDSSDGAVPIGLVQGANGELYGTTELGGAYNEGTVFQIVRGVLTTLHSFSESDGIHPNTLMQATDGNFYGGTSLGGTRNNGTVYRVAMGFAPFVKLVPSVGTVGQAIIILGTDLGTTSSVTFNGLPANYSVVSPTFVYADVPSGATTGPVVVITSSGTLTSNVSFQVLP